MINESDCSRDFSKEMTKKYRDTHKKIRNCNEFDNSLNFAKVSARLKMPYQRLIVLRFLPNSSAVFLAGISMLKH